MSPSLAGVGTTTAGTTTTSGNAGRMMQGTQSGGNFQTFQSTDSSTIGNSGTNLAKTSPKVVFIGPCYVSCAYGTPASMTVTSKTPLSQPVVVSGLNFTLVSGETSQVVQIDGTSFPLAASATFGPNSWGTLQGTATGYELYMTPTPTATSAVFNNPTTSGVTTTRTVSAITSVSVAPTVTSEDSGFWCGFSDTSSLKVTASAQMGPSSSVTSNSASSGQQLTWPSGYSIVALTQFAINPPSGGTTTWVASRNVDTGPMGAAVLVVMGTYNSPYLAIMPEWGPIVFVPLAQRAS
jgi:hypothetical protein